MSEAEKKGITVKIDADLHAQVKQYIEANGITMAEFVSKALDDELHPKTTNGNEFGVYVGGGEVVFSSAMSGVQRQRLTDGSWTAWCTFDAVKYPQEVQDKINELHGTSTEATNEETTGG